MQKNTSTMKHLRQYIFPLLLSTVIWCSIIYMNIDEPIQASSGAITEESMIIMTSPPCIELHDAIEKYSKIYMIPKNYAYGIAYSETRYRGAFDWTYFHKQTSYAGALGPMQVMFETAKMMFPEKHFSRDFLRDNIDFNVECSMKLLRKLKDDHGDWKIVFGAYNTGKPLVNDYAIKVYNYKRI